MPDDIRKKVERTQTFVGIKDVDTLTRTADKEFDEFKEQVNSIIQNIYGGSNISGGKTFDPPPAPILDEAESSFSGNFDHEQGGTGEKYGALYWLRQNYPVRKEGSNDSLPRILIRINHGGEGKLSSLLLEQDITLILGLSVYKQDPDLQTYSSTAQTILFTELVTEIDSARGYSEMEILDPRIDVNDHVGAIYVAFAGPGGTTETAYGCTDAGGDRDFKAGTGVSVPEALQVVKRKRNNDHLKLKLKFERPVDLTEPYSGEVSNYYEKIELWCAYKGEGADEMYEQDEEPYNDIGTNPDSEGTAGWIFEKEKNIERHIKNIRKAMKAGKPYAKYQKIKIKLPVPDGLTCKNAQRIIDIYGQKGPWEPATEPDPPNENPPMFIWGVRAETGMAPKLIRYTPSTATWESVAFPSDITVDPTTPAILKYCNGNGKLFLLCASAAVYFKLYESPDFGDTWTEIGTDSTWQMQPDSSTNYNWMYGHIAASVYGDRLYCWRKEISTSHIHLCYYENGAWTNLSTVPSDITPTGYYNPIIISPLDDTLIWCFDRGTNDFAYSPDSGASWTTHAITVSGAGVNCRRMIASSTSGILYAVSSETNGRILRGVWNSGTSTWDWTAIGTVTGSALYEIWEGQDGSLYAGGTVTGSKKIPIWKCTDPGGTPATTQVTTIPDLAISGTWKCIEIKGDILNPKLFMATLADDDTSTLYVAYTTDGSTWQGVAVPSSIYTVGDLQVPTDGQMRVALKPVSLDDPDDPRPPEEQTIYLGFTNPVDTGDVRGLYRTKTFGWDFEKLWVDENKMEAPPWGDIQVDPIAGSMTLIKCMKPEGYPGYAKISLCGGEQGESSWEKIFSVVNYPRQVLMRWTGNQTYILAKSADSYRHIWRAESRQGGGATMWTKIFTGTATRDAVAMCLDRTNDKKMYVATSNGHVFVCSDITAATPTFDDGTGTYDTGFGTDKLNWIAHSASGVLYVGGVRDGLNGILRSASVTDLTAWTTLEDAGTKMDDCDEIEQHGIVVGYGDPALLLVLSRNASQSGIWLSLDYGATWTEIDDTDDWRTAVERSGRAYEFLCLGNGTVQHLTVDATTPASSTLVEVAGIDDLGSANRNWILGATAQTIFPAGGGPL